MATPRRPALARILALLLTIAGAAAAPVAALAQDDRIPFRHLTIDDGLSQSAVSALVQDRRGFVWVGTKDGLNRYDGYRFVVFRHHRLDPHTLSDSDVTALHEDDRGVLWVGTRAGGLNSFDPRTERFQRHGQGPTRPITAITGTGDGAGLWVATDGGGLYRYDRATAAFVRFRHDPAEERSLSHDRVFAVLVDRGGTLWVGTQMGLDRLEPGPARGAVTAPAGDAASFVHYRAGPDTPLGLIDSTVTALHEDRDGRLWIGSIPGLSVLDPDRSRIRHYYHRYRTERYGWGQPEQILADGTGRLWITTLAALMLFDPATGAFTYQRHDALDPASLNSDQTTALLRDRSGVIWVGTNGYGINLHDPKANRFHTFRGSLDPESRATRFSVYTLFEDSERRLWIDAGLLYRWDRATGELVSLETAVDRFDDFGNTGVWAMVEDPPGFLWAGTYAGLFHYEIATGRARRYRPDPDGADRPGSLPEMDVREVFQARDGTLWLATENYLARLEDPARGRFVAYRYTDPATRGVWAFPTLHEDAAGVLWLGSHQGLVRFDPGTGEMRRFQSDPGDPASLSHDAVRALSPDPARPERYLWVATAGGGLNRLDLEAETFDHFTMDDGLPNDVVYGILPDDDGRLWLSTNRGLSRFDPGTRTFRNYDVEDGLQSNEFNSGAYFRSASGELFFGGLYGFSYFRPEEIRDNPHVPEVVITAFRRANRYETVGDSGSVLTAAVPYLDTLRLSHRDNAIGFEFAALDFSAPGKNRYAYRLLGYSDEWVEAGAERSASYTHLPPGWYTFQARGSNNDGVWNEAGASLVIRIVPPWWGTTWAYALYVLLVAAALYALRRYELGRDRLRNRLELEQLEAEKLRDLDQAKSRFFADVSHEFRTPLTLTLGPLDDLLDGLHGPLADGARGQVELARRSARRVLELVNQILELARLEAGRATPHPRRLDLVELVDRCVQAFAPLAERNSLALDLFAPPGPLHLHGDPEQLEKALSNLLSNALKFTPAGGTVRVSVEADERSARVVVRDSGQGIPAHELPRVFDRFHRVDDPARSHPGTGIGLALAKELVELHGGTLAAESEEGFGSTFTLTIPRGDAALLEELRAADGAVARPRSLPSTAAALLGDGEDPSAGPEPATEGADGRLEPPDEDITTVLVVEDNEEVRSYLRRHLARSYRVLEAADGEAGLDRVRTSLPDLVISDVMMPVRDGLSLCRAIKDDPDTDFIPVILLTARAAAEDRIAGLRQEADDYLVKPFRPDELLARVANLIASRKRLRERFATPALVLGATPAPIESADAKFLEQVRAAIEDHLDDDAFTVERLARDVAHSRGHLHRRLTDLTGEAPSDLIRRTRLEHAARLLEAGAGSVSSIAYAVGFKSVSHFSNRFQDRFGVRPSAYRARATT